MSVKKVHFKNKDGPDLQEENKKLLSKIDDLQSQLNYLTSRQHAFELAAIEAIIILVDSICIETNDAARRLFEYGENELIGLKLSVLVKEEYLEQLKNFTANPDITFFEVEAVTKNGTIFWAQIQAKSTVYNSQKACLFTIKDISEQKKVEAENKGLQNFYSNLFQLSPGGIVLENSQGVIVDANDAFCENMQYKREDIIGQKVHKLAHPENRHKVDEHIQRILAGETLNFVEKSLRNDGTECYIHLNEHKIKLPNGEDGILSIAQDITEPKMAEKALRESEMRLSATIRSAHLGTWDENIKEGTVKRNKRWSEMLGYNEAEIEDTIESWQKLIHPDDLKKVERLSADFFKKDSKDIFEVEHRLRHKDGSWRWVLNWGKIVEWDDNGNAIRAVGTHLDITERKLAEENLRKSEQRYRELLDILPFPSLIHSEKIVRYVNSAAIKVLLGNSSDEFIGKNIDSWIHPESRNKSDKRITEVYQKQTTLDLARYKFFKNDKSIFQAEVKATHTEFEGKPASLVSFVDISERVLAEEKLKASEKRFRSIVENSHASIILVGTNYEVIYHNPQFEKLTGYSDAELENIDFRKLLSVESIELVSNYYRRRHLGEDVPKKYEFDVLRKDGTLRHVEIRTEILPDNNRVSLSQLLDITERRTAEAAMKESELRYRTLAETAKDMILIHDLNGNIIYANQAAKELTGYGSGILKINIVDLVAENFKDDMRNRQNKRMQEDNSKFLFELEILNIKKGHIPVEVSSAMMQTSEENKLVLLVARDISDRIKTLEALTQSEKQFKQLVSNSLTGIYITRNNEIRFCNQQFAEMFGYDAIDELIGIHIKKLVHPDSWSLVTKEVSARQSGEKETSRYEFIGIRKNGTPFECEVLGGRIIYEGELALQGTTIDISARKKAETQIARLATVVEQAVESIVITNVDGVIQYVNPSFSEITGYTSDEVIGKKPNILKSGKHNSDFYKDLWDTILNGNKWQNVIINKRKDGEFYHEKAVIFPIKDEQDNLISFAAIMRDITVERKLEFQLQQVQKMEAIGTLSGGIAHDFNNLLTVINGHAEMAMLRTPKELKAHSDFMSILKAGKRAEKLTNQLLAFSRKQVHELKVVEANNLIRDMEKMLRRLIPADIHIEMVLESQNLHIKADPGQIEQIILNLVVNARDAIQAYEKTNAKKIEIRTRIIQDGAIETTKIPDTQFWPSICISVSDTGTGMSEETKMRIFEPFFTTKEVGKGTGLGLATVYGIVQQNKAFMDVQSKKNEGSVFSLYWPICNEKASENDELKVSTENLKGTEKILFVEDDEGVRNLTVESLKNFGYTVYEAVNGKDALEVVNKLKPEIDLVITDLIMPEINGEVLINKMRARYLIKNVLFVSGYTYDHLQKDGALKENIYFLQKPYTIQKLLKMIRKIVNG